MVDDYHFALPAEGGMPSAVRILPMACDVLPCMNKPVDPLYQCSLLRHDLRQTVRAFAVTEEMTVWHRNLTISKAFPLSLGYILQDAAALLLGKAGYDGD